MIRPIEDPMMPSEARSDWTTRPWTLKKTIALMMWWVMCMILPPFSIIIGGIVGAIYGIASGMLRGAIDSYTELRRWWEMFVNI